IDLAKRDDAWKVDPRWWLALHTPDDGETALVRQFVRYAVGGNPGQIADLALPHPELYALSLREGHSSAQLAMLDEMTGRMPIIRLRAGDIYAQPGQQAVVVTADDVSENRQLLLAYFNQNKLP